MMMLQELRDQVTNTVGAGLDLTGQIIRTGVPLAQSALEQAPRVLNTARSALDVINEPENRERVNQITGVGTRVAAGASRVASGAPELVSQVSIVTNHRPVLRSRDTYCPIRARGWPGASSMLLTKRRPSSWTASRSSLTRSPS